MEAMLPGGDRQSDRDTKEVVSEGGEETREEQRVLRFAEILYKCSLCTTLPCILTSKAAFFTHVRDCHQSPKSPGILCGFCDLHFETNTDLRVHVAHSHSSCGLLGDSFENFHSPGNLRADILRMSNGHVVSTSRAIEDQRVHGDIVGNEQRGTSHNVSVPSQGNKDSNGHSVDKEADDKARRRASSSSHTASDCDENSVSETLVTFNSPPTLSSEPLSPSQLATLEYHSRQHLGRLHGLTEPRLSPLPQPQSHQLNDKGWGSLFSNFFDDVLNGTPSFTPEFGRFTKLIREGGKIVYFCQVCNVKCHVRAAFQVHCNGLRHHHKVSLAGKNKVLLASPDLSCDSASVRISPAPREPTVAASEPRGSFTEKMTKFFQHHPSVSALHHRNHDPVELTCRTRFPETSSDDNENIHSHDSQSNKTEQGHCYAGAVVKKEPQQPSDGEGEDEALSVESNDTDAFVGKTDSERHRPETSEQEGANVRHDLPIETRKRSASPDTRGHRSLSEAQEVDDPRDLSPSMSLTTDIHSKRRRVDHQDCEATLKLPRDDSDNTTPCRSDSTRDFPDKTLGESVFPMTEVQNPRLASPRIASVQPAQTPTMHTGVQREEEEKRRVADAYSRIEIQTTDQDRKTASVQEYSSLCAESAHKPVSPTERLSTVDDSRSQRGVAPYDDSTPPRRLDRDCPLGDSSTITITTAFPLCPQPLTINRAWIPDARAAREEPTLLMGRFHDADDVAMETSKSQNNEGWKVTQIRDVLKGMLSLGAKGCSVSRDVLLYRVSAALHEPDVQHWGPACNRAVRDLYPHCMAQRKGKFKKTYFFGLSLLPGLDIVKGDDPVDDLTYRPLRDMTQDLEQLLEHLPGLLYWSGHVDRGVTRDEVLHVLALRLGESEVYQWGMQCNKALRMLYPLVVMKRKGKYKTVYFGVDFVRAAKSLTSGASNGHIPVYEQSDMIT